MYLVWFQALLELNGKLESMQKEHYIYDNALTQLRAAMGERERRRGRPYFDNNAASSQTPTMLVHAAERALQEADADAECHKDRIKQVQFFSILLICRSIWPSG